MAQNHSSCCIQTVFVSQLAWWPIFQELLIACGDIVHVAQHHFDVAAGEVAPLECNLDALSGISYSKGCYIGQERNSYTHYRGIIRKRMMPVLLPGLDQETRKWSAATCS